MKDCSGFDFRQEIILHSNLDAQPASLAGLPAGIALSTRMDLIDGDRDCTEQVPLKR